MAAKIVDGLFIGDALSSMDLTFVVANKITTVVNCAGLELENCFGEFGIEYLTFEWEKQQADLSVCDRELAVAQSDCPLPWLESFKEQVDLALSEGHGVLVHSQDGRNRACSCILAYLMHAYVWDLDKAISFVRSKRPDLVPANYLCEQLTRVSRWLEQWYCSRLKSKMAAGAKLSQRLIAVKLHTWQVANHELCAVSLRLEDEILVHNTYINSGATGYNHSTSPNCTSSAASHSPSPLTACYISNDFEDSEQHETYATVLKRKPLQATGQTPGRSRKKVAWIDALSYPDHSDRLPKQDLPNHVLLERPPGPSYDALHVTGRWLDQGPEASPNYASKHQQHHRKCDHVQQNYPPLSHQSSSMLWKPHREQDQDQDPNLAPDQDQDQEFKHDHDHHQFVPETETESLHPPPKPIWQSIPYTESLPRPKPRSLPASFDCSEGRTFGGRESPQKMQDFKGRSQNKNFTYPETTCLVLPGNKQFDLDRVRQRLLSNGMAVLVDNRRELGSAGPVSKTTRATTTNAGERPPLTARNSKKRPENSNSSGNKPASAPKAQGKSTRRRNSSHSKLSNARSKGSDTQSRSTARAKRTSAPLSVKKDTLKAQV
mmetsp:Transcript_21072/g.39156  ORF Transcript_21072/g.39156 Transcript_21072/m.39156 type:complete len:603 (+) Transcript_21072:362-2170(+)